MWPGLSWANLHFPAMRLLMVTGRSTIQVYQSPGSNALQTAENVYAELAKLKKSFPADVDYTVPYESVTIIKVSMDEVVGTLLKLWAWLPLWYSCFCKTGVLP
jgi:hypothetical protein